jgi:nucleotide-binding universal stress UspA family protein
MKILVGTDGSKSSMKAIREAVRLAKLAAAGSTITVVSVHDETAFFHAERFVGRDVVADYLRELSDKELMPARRLLEKSGIRHDFVIRTGHVASEIVKTAEKGKYDLVVVGSKGRSAFEDLLIGSVARRVAETCRVPVTIVK